MDSPKSNPARRQPPGENCSVVSGRSSVQRARIKLELDQEVAELAVLKAEARRLKLQKQLNDHDARSSARSRTSRNSVADQLALTTADPTLARAPEQVAHARHWYCRHHHGG